MTRAAVALASATGGRLTVRTALELMTEPKALVTRTEYAPACASWTLVRMSDAPVAPGKSAPERRHWYFRTGLPAAVTEKVAMAPWLTRRLAGCATIVGGSRHLPVPRDLAIARISSAAKARE